MYSSGYSCILCHNFQNISVYWWCSLGAPDSISLCTEPIWKHLGESVRISVAVQSCWVVQLWLPNHFTLCQCCCCSYPHTRVRILPQMTLQLALGWVSYWLQCPPVCNRSVYSISLPPTGPWLRIVNETIKWRWDRWWFIELSIVQREKKIDIYIEKQIISITKCESTTESTMRKHQDYTPIRKS
jgi:hypothetical protein